MSNLKSRREFLVGTAGVLTTAALASSPLARANSVKNDSIPDKITKLNPATGYAFTDYSLKLTPYNFDRRGLMPKDVLIEIKYCGVCHSDLHTARGDWGEQIMPQVTGHEMAGIVTAIGHSVTKFKVGDRVGVGTMVDSCGHCPECRSKREQYCENFVHFSYGTPTDKKLNPTGITQGGYSNRVVVTEHFVCHIPDNLELQHAGPLMCAGTTVYSPLRHWNIRKGMLIAVIGLGGLGHLAVKIATALGAEVVVLTTSPDKVSDAKRFGAKDVIVNFDAKKLAEYRRKFDFILGVTPYRIEIDSVIPTLKRDATFCLVGISPIKQLNQISPFTNIISRTSFAGSLTGSMAESQEILDFCAEKGIKPEVELIDIKKTTDAWEKMLAKKSRYRYVIDMESLKS